MAYTSVDVASLHAASSTQPNHQAPVLEATSRERSRSAPRPCPAWPTGTPRTRPLHQHGDLAEHLRGEVHHHAGEPTPHQEPDLVAVLAPLESTQRPRTRGHRAPRAADRLRSATLRPRKGSPERMSPKWTQKEMAKVAAEERTALGLDLMAPLRPLPIGRGLGNPGLLDLRPNRPRLPARHDRALPYNQLTKVVRGPHPHWQQPHHH